MAEQPINPAKGSTGAGEGKGTAEELKAEPKTGAEAGAPAKGAEGAPALKPLELKLPEGSLLEAGAVERIASYAKERGLSQGQAQELLQREHQAIATHVEGQKEALTKQMGAWVEELKADKELGGDDFSKNVETAKRVVQKFGTEAFRKALADTGLGNHPELVRIFARIGKTMSEDTLVQPGGVPGPKRSMEEVFYGQPKEKEA